MQLLPGLAPIGLDLGVAFLSDLLWVWPSLGESRGPGSLPHLLFFLLLRMEPVVLRILGRVGGWLLSCPRLSCSPFGAGTWALQHSEGGACVHGVPSSWVLFTE